MKFACDERALIYIAGYVSFKCGSKTSCIACKAALVSDRDLAVDSVDLDVDVSYVDQLNRGGLKYPSYMVVMCGYRVYSIVQVLLTPNYEDKFLKVANQRQ